MLSSEKERRQTTKELKQNIIDNKRTSAHVAIKLMKLAGFDSQAEKIKQILGRII